MNYVWWSDPIFDRNQGDIDYLTRKSRLNASDLNRIEGNIGWLNERWKLPTIELSTWDDIEDRQITWDDLTSSGIQWGITTRRWYIGGLDLINSEIIRIVRNAQSIKQYLRIQSDLFSTVLFWSDLNAIERLIYDAHLLYINWLEWDCFECKFSSWDDLDESNLSWDELEMLPCDAFTWNSLAEKYKSWDELEEDEITWNDLECVGVD